MEVGAREGLRLFFCFGFVLHGSMIPLPHPKAPVSDFLYVIPCPRCGTNISLLETNLVGIIRNRRVSTTGEPILTFVCQQCKNCFQWDYHKRKSVGLFPEPPQNTAHPVVFSTVAECENGDCEAQVEVIAIRSPGTTREQIDAERPSWRADDIY